MIRWGNMNAHEVKRKIPEGQGCVMEELGLGQWKRPRSAERTQPGHFWPENGYGQNPRGKNTILCPCPSSLQPRRSRHSTLHHQLHPDVFNYWACYGPSKNKYQKVEPEHISTLLRSLNRRWHIFIQKAPVVSLLSAISLPGPGNWRNGSHYQEDC